MAFDYCDMEILRLMYITLGERKVTVLLWQVPQQIKLAGSFERDLPEIWGTCQTNIFSCEGHLSHLELLESSLLAI